MMSMARATSQTGRRYRLNEGDFFGTILKDLFNARTEIVQVESSLLILTCR